MANFTCRTAKTNNKNNKTMNFGNKNSIKRRNYLVHGRWSPSHVRQRFEIDKVCKEKYQWAQQHTNTHTRANSHTYTYLVYFQGNCRTESNLVAVSFRQLKYKWNWLYKAAACACNKQQIYGVQGEFFSNFSNKYESIVEVNMLLSKLKQK